MAPEKFSFRYEKATISATYNPSVYTEDEIRRAAAPICDKVAMINASFTSSENGLVEFTADCASGAPLGVGRAEVRKLASGRIEVTFRGGDFTGRTARTWTA
ncbi:MAG: hypothetical protein AAGF71_15370 [Pseudomonadota bacterium]